MALPLSNGKTLLVTGINGYIASTLGHLILTKGYNLRGTSRTLASTQALVSGAYAPYASRVQMVEVPDITVPGAFDKAVEGVHGIFHTASPINLTLKDYDDVIVPAVAGTETLLKSALQHAGPQLEAVVVTSSIAAMIDSKPEPEYVYTEADFASQSLEGVEKDKAEGKETPGFILYAASKTAAERAVWKFKDEEKPAFSISTIHPAVTVGPPVQPPSDPSKLNTTLESTWSIFSGAALPSSFGSGSFVDVRDVAFIHLWAYEHPESSNGQRYIASSGFGPSQAIADILREVYPDRRDVIPVGTPGEGYIGFENGRVVKVEYPKGRISISSKKAQKEMGIVFRDFKQSLVDTAKVMERYL